MDNKINKEDWLLRTIAEAGEKGLTPAKLQKSLFLLGKAFPKELPDFYSFEPYNYGPFDISIYQEADVFSAKGLITKKSVAGYDWSKYIITKEGKKRIADMSALFDKEMEKYLTTLMEWIQPLSFQELISSVYKKYPEYKINSVFIDK